MCCIFLKLMQPRSHFRSNAVSFLNQQSGPDFSKITTVRGDPSLINEESERITKIIQGDSPCGTSMTANLWVQTSTNCQC